MKIANTIIGWTPVNGPHLDGDPVGQIECWPIGSEPAHAHAYTSTDGGCWSWMQDASNDVLAAYVKGVALGMIVRDGLDPQRVNEVLMQIDEYAQGVATDMPHQRFTDDSIPGKILAARPY